MPKTNKKTKKIVAKKVKRALKPRVKKTAAPKAKNVIKAKSDFAEVKQAAPIDLGVKIPVLEIKSVAAPEVVEPIFEETDLSQDENKENLNDEIQPEIPADYQEQDLNLQAYPQKDFSPRTKNIIMYASITSIMAVLVLFWGLNIKNSFGRGIPNNDNSGAQTQQWLDEIKNSFGDLQAGLDQAPSQNTNTTDQAAALSQKINEAKVKDDVANQLKTKLENLNTNNANLNANINTNVNANTTNLNSAN